MLQLEYRMQQINTFIYCFGLSKLNSGLYFLNNYYYMTGCLIKFRNENDVLFKEKQPALGEHNWQNLYELLEFPELK